MDVRAFLEWYKSDSHKQGYAAGMVMALEQKLTTGYAFVHDPTQIIRDAVYDPQKLNEFKERYRTPLPETIENMEDFQQGWMEGTQQGSSIIDDVDRYYPRETLLHEVETRYSSVLQLLVTPSYDGRSILQKVVQHGEHN